MPAKQQMSMTNLLILEQKMKTIDWRETPLATGLAALTSQVPSEPTRMALMKCDLLHALVTSSSRVPLLPGLCSPARASLLPAASRSRSQGSHGVGSPPLLTDDILESCDSAALQGSPLPGREKQSAFSLSMPDWKLPPTPTALQS